MQEEKEQSQPSSNNDELRLSPGDISVGVGTFLTACSIDLIGHYGFGGMLVGSMATVLATGFGDEIILASKEVIALARQVFLYLSGRQERQQLPLARKGERQALPSVQESKPTMMLPEEEFIDWEEGNMSDEEDMSDDGFPTSVRYEDIRYRIPRGHVLVGIGRNGIETKEKAIGSCVWIVGLSGTGKTSTTVLRVDERATDGHKFLGVDPHWFKPDSLTNAVSSYANKFVKPIARTPEETTMVLKAFIAEFKARKDGRVPQPWQKVTLLVDEVGALMDPTDEQEEENAKLLPSIARICGQEARNFNMGGIFISQQATGLAWLRKVALMVIVHQLLMESEKKLACNGDMNAVEDMKTWPVGRTYVYGIGFGKDGPRTVQQPYFEPPQEVDDSFLPDLPMKKPFLQDEPCLPYVSDSVSTHETAIEADTRILYPPFGNGLETETVSVKNEAVSEEIKRVIRQLHKRGMIARDASAIVGLSGEKYKIFAEVCREMGLDFSANKKREGNV